MAETCCARFQKWLSLLLYGTGLGLSCYALHVEQSYSQDPENFRALCDIDESHSCSKVFTSEYGKGFGFVGAILGDENHVLNQPNCLYGIVFYNVMGITFLLFGTKYKFVAEVQFYCLILVNFVSCYLGFILYKVLKVMCVVCVSTYGVNFLLLVLAYLNRKRLRNKVVPEYSKFETRRSDKLATLPFDFKKNI